MLRILHLRRGLQETAWHLVPPKLAERLNLLGKCTSQPERASQRRAVLILPASDEQLPSKEASVPGVEMSSLELGVTKQGMKTLGFQAESKSTRLLQKATPRKTESYAWDPRMLMKTLRTWKRQKPRNATRHTLRRHFIRPRSGNDSIGAKQRSQAGRPQ